jgi:NAD(P)-dependent dehydrogenase (short-subunit alcohol dehydrogenase family)
MRFQGKVTLVTGAGGGIGRAAAVRFAEQGSDVVVADVSEVKAAAAAQEILELGRDAIPVTADVGKTADSLRMVEEALRHFGQIDVVFSNAGIMRTNTVDEMPIEVWDEVIRVNLRGVFLTCKHTIPALIAAGGGAIVTMGSSTAGWDTLDTGAAYMASKEAITGLTKSLAIQLGGYGIRVNSICPGIIETNLGEQSDSNLAELRAKYDAFAKRIPLRRVGQPEDVADAVTFLASDEARHITGSMLLIDGGQTLQSWSNAPNDEAYPYFGD